MRHGLVDVALPDKLHVTRCNSPLWYTSGSLGAFMRNHRILIFLALTMIGTPLHSSSGRAGDFEFFAVVADEALAEDDIVEYQTGPHVLRYQIVTIDSRVLREFIERDAELSDRDNALPLRLALFDEEPIEYFGEISQFYSEAE